MSGILFAVAMTTCMSRVNGSEPPAVRVPGSRIFTATVCDAGECCESPGQYALREYSPGVLACQEYAKPPFCVTGMLAKFCQLLFGELHRIWTIAGSPVKPRIEPVIDNGIPDVVMEGETWRVIAVLSFGV